MFGTTLLGLTLLAAVPGDAPAAADWVDFSSQVQPILQGKCWRCHSAAKQQGGLRLDQREFLERGGASGRSLLAKDLKRNELLRRLQSTEPGVRMPLEGPPLSAAEIATLGRWLEQGGVWPAAEAAAPPDVPLHWAERLFRFYERPDVQFYRPAIYVLLAGLVVLGICERARQWGQRASFSRGWAGGLCRAVGGCRNSLLLAVPAAALIYGLYLRGNYHAQEARAAHIQLSGTTGKSNEQYGVDPHKAPLRPKHPPRLGGKYYRGNDERNPELFNGGYYRTCTFDVSLRRADGKVLAWGDAVSGPLMVRLEIERSPFSTPELFGKGIMGPVALVGVPPETTPIPPDAPQAPLQQVVEGEKWFAEYRLPPGPGQRLSGVLHLYKNLHPRDSGAPGFTGESHYCIGYVIDVRDGKLSTESELWMASTYNVSSIQYPLEGKLTPAEWFDALPIHEIVGGNSSDRKLLGVLEHIPERAKQAEAPPGRPRPPQPPPEE